MRSIARGHPHARIVVPLTVAATAVTPDPRR
jgi:hypothetical protein